MLLGPYWISTGLRTKNHRKGRVGAVGEVEKEEGDDWSR